MKKIISVVLVVILLMASSASAEYYLNPIDKLNTQERNIFDSILEMMETVYPSWSSNKNTSFGFPAYGKQREFRVLELVDFPRDNAGDYVYIRFVRTGTNAKAMDTYYELSVEDYLTSKENPEHSECKKALNMYFVLRRLNGEDVMLDDVSNGAKGYFRQIWFSDGGKSMAETRSWNAYMIKRINDALDEYWKNH